MVIEIKNKWGFYMMLECLLWIELLKFYVLLVVFEDLFMRSCYVNIVDCWELVFCESFNLILVLWFIVIVVIYVLIVFDFDDV